MKIHPAYRFLWKPLIKASFYSAVIASLFPISFSHADSAPPLNRPFRFYGFLLPSFTYGTQEVESFSRQNAVAYTAVSNPVLSSSPERSTLTLQLEQSRFGFTIGEGSPTSGTLEFDFIDTSKSQAWVNAYPRLRRAFIEYRLDPENKIQMGQDWDIFSPLMPHTYNLVGHYFESGDVGFMRQQLVWMNQSQEHRQWAIALGMPGSNPTPQFSSKEISLTPTLALRLTEMHSGNRYGFSILGTSLLVNKETGQRLFAGGVNLFLEHRMGAFDLRSELYLGKNLNNLGTHGLSYGEVGHDLAEWGGWVTGLYHVNETFGIFGGMGISKIIHPEKLLPSYTRDATTGVASLSTHGPGIEQNGTLRLGLEQALKADLKAYIEGAYLNTIHHLASSDQAGVNPRREAVITQVGMMYTF